MDGRLETDVLCACLSIAIRCFFPDKDSTEQFPKSHFTPNFDNDSFQMIRTGSVKEDLCLPNLVDNIAGKRIFHNDEDTMFCYKDSELMEFVIQEDRALHKSLRPCYCYLRLNTQEIIPELIFQKQDLLQLNQNVYIKNGFLTERVFPLLDKRTNEKYPTEMQSGFRRKLESDDSPAFTIEGDKTDSDYVPCITVPWPRDAAPWQKRKRKYDWPTSEVISSIVSDGCHLVRKPHELTQEDYPDQPYKYIEWRYSFSLAEVTIAETLNPFQRIAYKVAKALVKYRLRLGIKSYLLKTTLFWVCEETPVSSWTLNNLGRQFLYFLDKLLYFLTQNYLPHYFVPDGNLIEQTVIKKPQEIQKWVEGLEDLRRHPLEHMEEFNIRYWLKEGYPLAMDHAIHFIIGTKLIGYELIEFLTSHSDITPEELALFPLFDVCRMFGCSYGAVCDNGMVLTIAKIDTKAVQRTGLYNIVLKEKGLGSLLNDLQILKEAYQTSIGFVSSEINTIGGILGRLEDGALDQILAVLHSELGCICYQMSENTNGVEKSHSLKEAEQYFRDAVRHDGCPPSVRVKYAQYLVVQRQYDEAFPVLQRLVDEHLEMRDKMLHVFYDKYTDKGIEATLRIMHAVEDHMSYSPFSLAYYLLLVCCMELGRNPEKFEIPDVGAYCQKLKQLTYYEQICAEIKLFEGCFLLRYGHTQKALNRFLELQEGVWEARPYTLVCIARLYFQHLGE